MNAFQPSRIDGRSDRVVIYDLVSNAEPDTLFRYDALADALQEGVDTPISQRRIGAAARAANKTLLKRDRRALGVVAGVGYRILRANEHLPAALAKKDSAEAQFAAGLALLTNLHGDELTDVERRMVEANALMFGGIVGALRVSNRRHDTSERRIDKMAEAFKKHFNIDVDNGEAGDS